MVEHRDELEEERARRRACAQHMMLGRVTSWPLSKAGWLSWLDQEPAAAAFNKALELAKSGARRAVNLRVTPHPDVPEKGSKCSLEAEYRYTPPRLGAQAQQRVARAALEGQRHQDCHRCGAFRRQVCCFCQALSLCVPEARNTCWFTSSVASVCVQEARNSCCLTSAAA